MTNTRERFDDQYRSRATAFVQAVASIDTTGIPEPHLPHWGTGYDTTPLKIGVIGRDTRGWGEMNNFIQAVRVDAVGAIHRGEGEFASLDFTGWTNNFGNSFWDTSMKFLAALHGIDDWKRLKRREDEMVLRSFFWANVNSVECYEASPKKNGVPWQTWRSVKDVSEQYFDSLSVLLDIFRPQIILVMNWEPTGRFLDVPLKWDEFGNHQAYAFHETTRTHILLTAHPSWLNKHSLYETALVGVIGRAKLVLRAAHGR